LVTSEAAPDSWHRRFEAAGAKLEVINYERGLLPYARGLRQVIRKDSIRTAHIRYFTASTALPWLVRLLGVRDIVLTDAESGVLGQVWWRGALLRLRARAVTYPVCRFVAISEFVKRRLVSLGIADERIVVIHNAVDTRHFRPDSDAKSQWRRRWAIPAGDVVLATASALEPRKNIATILESVALLTRRGVAVRLFIAGEGSLRTELERLSERLGIADRTYWLGYIATPRDLLLAADVFVLSSVGEAFGNVLAEAMACGVPIVASRSGGIAEVIDDGETGLLVPPGTPSAFAEAIETLVRNPVLSQEVATRARERVKERFGLTEFAAKTMSVYEAMWDGKMIPRVDAPARLRTPKGPASK
jgi:glycosyltransferase involved in cell wall biosynthesis